MSARVGFIKIDVEGHGLRGAGGALGIIERDHPTVLVEAEERHRSGAVGSVRELLEQRGYCGFFLFHGRMESIDGFSRDKHQDEAALLQVGFRSEPMSSM